jgi:hypothetical protein
LTGSRNTGTVEDMVTPPSLSETKPEPVVNETVADSSAVASDNDDETLSYFSKLAEEE